MWAYLLRRLLWMIPTLGAILVINFALLRVRAPGLKEEMAQAGGLGEAGTMSAETRTAGVASYLVTFRRNGYDLPAVLNLQGFTRNDRGNILAILRETERRPDAGLVESDRQRTEIDLWLTGHFALAPLAEILADDSLAHFHGPASEAFVYCALRPILTEEADLLSSDAQGAIHDRNEELLQLIIMFTNTKAAGFVTTDPEAATKRARLAELMAAHRDEWGNSAWQAWGALFVKTGFIDICGKLFTGRLYSTSRKTLVFTLIGQRWAVSFWLNILSVLLAWAVSIPLGIRSARRQGSLEDAATTNALFFLWSLPSFFVGTLFIYHLCTAHQAADGTLREAWFPHLGLPPSASIWYTTPRWLLAVAWHGLLPLLTLTYASFTALSRYMRGNLLDQLNADYVRTARAKGCDEHRIVYHHALRNSMVTMITLGSGLLASLFGGFLVVELLWSIPGLGTLMLDAAKNNDAPLLMGSTLITVLLLLISILVADILYAVVDPRIRARYA